MSRRTWRSNIAGPKIKRIGCRPWRPICEPSDNYIHVETDELDRLFQAVQQWSTRSSQNLKKWFGEPVVDVIGKDCVADGPIRRRIRKEARVPSSLFGASSMLCSNTFTFTTLSSDEPAAQRHFGAKGKHVVRCNF
jgi:hypothetical protein